MLSILLLVACLFI